MVRQRGPNDAEPYWYIPGGSVEPGESAAEAVARELREETGLTLVSELRVAYQSDTGTAFEVSGWTGAVRSADPDGLVSEASFVPFPEALERLRRVPHAILREGLIDYLERC